MYTTKVTAELIPALSRLKGRMPTSIRLSTTSGGRAHPDRGDEMVGRDHHQSHGQGAEDQAQHRAGPGMAEPVDAAGHQHQGTCGNDVHQDAPGAGGTDEHALDDADHHGEDQAGHRP